MVGNPFHRTQKKLCILVTKEIIKANKDLIDRIVTIANYNSYSESCLASGTNRQDYKYDKLNAEYQRGTFEEGYVCHGSFYPRLLAIYNHVKKICPNITLDKTLMSDLGNVTSKSERGKNFDAIINGEQYKADGWVFDDKKSTLIYYHSQDEKLSRLCFIDDRKDILEFIKEFYAANEDLLPSNCTLNLLQYDGTFGVEYTVTPSKDSMVDENPEETLLKFYKQYDNKKMILKRKNEYHHL